VTEGSADVRVAFPKILSELEPADAVLLNDAYAFEAQDHGDLPLGSHEGHLNLRDPDLVSLSNLMRNELVTAKEETADNLITLRLTPLGDAFVQACQDPSARPSEPPPSSGSADG
jgi:hypothetical protein